MTFDFAKNNLTFSPILFGEARQEIQTTLKDTKFPRQPIV